MPAQVAMPRDRHGLTPKERAFADAYLLNSNGSASVIAAGYSASGASVTANRLLRRPKVAEYLSRKQAKQHQVAETLQQRLLAELEAIAFANLGEFTRVDEHGNLVPDFTGATPEQLRALSLNTIQHSVRTLRDNKGNVIGEESKSKVSKDDKLRGIEMLGRHLGMFKPEEHKVVVDVADRLLSARQRYMSLAGEGGDDAVE